MTADPDSGSIVFGLWLLAGALVLAWAGAFAGLVWHTILGQRLAQGIAHRVLPVAIEFEAFGIGTGFGVALGLHDQLYD